MENSDGETTDNEDDTEEPVTVGDGEESSFDRFVVLIVDYYLCYKFIYMVTRHCMPKGRMLVLRLLTGSVFKLLYHRGDMLHSSRCNLARKSRLPLAVVLWHYLFR